MRRLILLASIATLAACTTTQQPGQSPKTGTASPLRTDTNLALLARDAAPERDAIRDRHRFDRAIRPTTIDGLRYYFYRPNGHSSIVGFALENTGSPTVNPVGLKKRGPRREYAFLFADRARENIYLTINDDVKMTGRFSHDNMFRELHFFPRRQLPSIKMDRAKGVIRLTLPTGEPVLVDPDSRELVGGALSESPIDFNRSRHHRRNPAVRYRGRYLAITVAQRGEAPRRAKVWGQTKFALAHYPAKYAKPCRLSPRHIWDQRPKKGDTDPTLRMLHKSDAQLFVVVERQCGWDLSDLKRVGPMLVEADG